MLVDGDPSDAGVLQDALTSADAFGAIVDRHGRAILSYLMRRVGPQAAEPLAAEVFAIAFEQRATFVSLRDGSALPWLYGIANNVVAGHRRREQRYLRSIEDAFHQSFTTDIDDEAVIERIDVDREFPAVAAALRKLPTRDRDTLVLHVWGGLTYEEVSEVLAIPIGTVRSRINRAKTRLRKELEPR